MGEILFETQEYEDAIDTYREAIRLAELLAMRYDEEDFRESFDFLNPNRPLMALDEEKKIRDLKYKFVKQLIQMAEETEREEIWDHAIVTL